MAPAIRIATDTLTHAVPGGDVAILTRELKRLDPQAYPSAEPLATILDAATADELGADVNLKPLENQALSRILEGLNVADDLTESLRGLWDGLRFDSPNSDISP